MAMLTTEPTQASQSGQNTPQHGARTKRPGLYALIFGGIVAAVTLISIGLAAIAPSLEPNASTAVPSGWAKVYNGDLTQSVDGWDTQHGCSGSQSGLFVQGGDQNGVICQYQPSASSNITSKGFVITAAVAPVAQTSQVEIPIITIGNSQSVLVLFYAQDVTVQGQNFIAGTYIICDATCNANASDALFIQGTTAAWHTDPYVANTITVRLDADGSTLTVYANGEQVATGTVNVDPNPQIAIGADAGGQALFTHVTIYSGSGA